MRILYFGNYSLNNQRNAVLMNGLKQNGVTVLECKDTTKYLLVRYVRLFFKHWQYRHHYDAMIVGFSGQEMMPLARLIATAPIVFDVFTSHYMGYILDRKYFPAGSLRARYYHFLDWLSCYLAAAVILDTQTHIDFFVKEFDLPKDKFHLVWLGANLAMFQARQRQRPADGKFRVVFWGNFIPLQGISYIIQAAKLLEHDNIDFYLIGKGQTFEKDRQLVETLGLKNVFLTGRLSQDELDRMIAGADVCLGAFGDSIKTDSTIQNKIFEALASERALISARTPAILELLRDGHQCLLCNKADSQDLADKIFKLKNNPELKNKIATNGHIFFQEHLTEKKLGELLLNVIQEFS